MTFADRVAALAPLGLPPRQTEFVVTVLLHGGYCVRRQFDAFIGRAHGQVGRNFFRTLLERGLATPIQYRPDAGQIFHLQAKRLYRALGQDDNRNRRAVSPALIARKLMVLDFVMTTPAAEWLATEQDKVLWFTRTAGIRLDDLPRRQYPSGKADGGDTTRYFVNKMPIRVDDPGSLTFVHLVEDETGRHFKTFIDEHVRVLSRMPRWGIALVCPAHLLKGGDVAARLFAEMFKAPKAAAQPCSPDELAWYFRVRAAAERRDLRAFSVADLDRYRDLRRSLASVHVEQLYAEWQIKGDSALSGAPRMTAVGERPFRIYLHKLPWKYQQFGRWPGAA